MKKEGLYKVRFYKIFNNFCTFKYILCHQQYLILDYSVRFFFIK